MKNTLRLALIPALAGLFSAGCGYKGPLIPPAPEPVAAKPAPAKPADGASVTPAPAAGERP